MLLVVLAAVRAQTPANVLTRAWTTADGLPQSTVTDLAQDPQGYLWLTSFGGLARFDGVHFEIWDVARGAGLSSDRLLTLLFDSNGRLWLGAQDAGVFLWTDGHFEVPSALDGLRGTTVWDIAETPDGALWIASDDGLFRFADGALRELGGLPDRHVLSLRVDRRERLWIGTLRGLARLDGERLDVLDRDRQVRSFAEGADGEVWLGTGRGIGSVRGEVVSYGPPDELWLHPVAVDRRGRVWTSDEAGPEVDGQAVTLPRPTLVRTFFEDREGSLWIGTNGQGLVQVRDAGFTRHRLPEDLSAHDVGPLLEDRAGRVWVGSTCAGLGRIEDGTVAIVVPDVCVRSLAEGPDGIWFVADRRLGRWNEGEVSYLGPEAGLPDAPLRAVFTAPDGQPWVASDSGGVFRLSEGDFHPVTGLEGLDVTSIAEGAGSLWFGTSDAIFRFTGGGVERVGAVVPAGGVRDLLVDPDGTLWIASYGGGLARFDGRATVRLTTQEGLPDGALACVLDDGIGNLWLNGNRGVSRVARAALDAVARGETGILDSVRLATGESSGGQPAGLRTRGGQLWFPTIDGVVSIDPDVGDPVPPPAVVIEQATVDARRDLHVQVTAPHFVDPGAVRFRHRLVGHDDQWITAPERSIRYQRLPPGSWELEVMARTATSGWSAPAVHAFVIPAHVQERWWFVPSMVAVALAAAAGLYRVRIRSAREQNRALQQEIEARMRVEAELRENEAHYRTIVEQASNGFVLLDADGNVLECTPVASRMLGVSMRPAGLEFVAPESRAAWLAGVRRACTGAPMEGAELTLLRAGARFPARVWGAPYARGERTLALLSLVDITEERRAAEERRVLDDRLRSAQKLEALGQLAGGVAHDFNNLLAVIVARASLLEEGEDGSPAVVAEEIQACARRGAALTRRLLAFGGRQRLRPQRVDPRAFLHAQERLLHAVLRDDVRVQVSCDASVPDLHVDPGELEQAVLNLVFNARDAMPGGGVLTLGATSVEGRVVLSVRDDGVGMEPEVLRRIFEPFFTTKGPGVGTGLGLSSVHGFAAQSGGFVTVTSAPGAGTCFEVHLPAASLAATPAADAVVALNEPLAILLVDDEEPLRRLLEALLRRSGHAVFAASDAAEALELTRLQRFDVLVTDVMMPGMSGPELARRIRGADPGMPVVFLSGYNREAGLADEVFVEKPCTLEALAGAIGRAMAGPAK